MIQVAASSFDFIQNVIFLSNFFIFNEERCNSLQNSQLTAQKKNIYLTSNVNHRPWFGRIINSAENTKKRMKRFILLFCSNIQFECRRSVYNGTDFL